MIVVCSALLLCFGFTGFEFCCDSGSTGLGLLGLMLIDLGFG